MLTAYMLWFQIAKKWKEWNGKKPSFLEHHGKALELQLNERN